MRTFVGNDQAYLVVDTTQRADSVMVILKAVDATPIFWSQERADLDSNIDSGGNPQAGMLLSNNDPPLVLIGARIVVWARATAQTKIECQVISQNIGVSAQPSNKSQSPGASPAVQAKRVNAPLPGFSDSWQRKGGFH